MAELGGNYVYGIKRNDSIVYVGRGVGRRVYRSLKAHNGDDFVIFVEGISKEQAIKHERMIIQALLNCGIELDNIAVSRKKVNL